MPPGFPQFATAPPEPLCAPPADVAVLIGRARRAMMRAAQLYSGEVYRILVDDMDFWIQGGYRFDKAGHMQRLVDQILTTPLPPRDPGA